LNFYSTTVDHIKFVKDKLLNVFHSYTFDIKAVKLLDIVTKFAFLHVHDKKLYDTLQVKLKGCELNEETLTKVATLIKILEFEDSSCKKYEEGLTNTIGIEEGSESFKVNHLVRNEDIDEAAPMLQDVKDTLAAFGEEYPDFKIEYDVCWKNFIIFPALITNVVTGKEYWISPLHRVEHLRNIPKRIRPIGYYLIDLFKSQKIRAVLLHYFEWRDLDKKERVKLISEKIHYVKLEEEPVFKKKQA